MASSYRGRAGLIAYQAQDSRAGGDLIEAGRLIKLYSLRSHFSSYRDSRTGLIKYFNNKC